jgi:hypothetical protein
MPEYFPENNTPLWSDTEVRSLQKIVGAVEGLSSSVISSLPADSFGRLRTSNPFTLFDSSHRYKDNSLWTTYTSGTASATFNASQGLVDLTIGSTSGDEIIRETTKVFSYQPGKSLLILSTFVMNPQKINLRQRVGYYGDDNGMYLELYGQVLTFVERSLVTGTVSETPIPQSEWNGDKLDGTGASGLTLDISKAQILWMDIEWLGLGTVRMGFIIDGKFITCHSFHHANLITSTYITTASLPLRYEIKNVGTPTPETSSVLKQVCSSVISEGGYELTGTQQAIGTPVSSPKSLITAGTYYPIISLRLKTSPDRLDAIVIITALSLLPKTTGSVNYNWRVVASGTSTEGTWVSAGIDSAVEYKLNGTGFSGGRILASGFTNSSNQATSAVDILKQALFKFQLERDGLTGTPYELTLVASADVNSSGILASMDWEEISR